jgi:hypothetical protein
LTGSVEQILSRLATLGFQVREGPVLPFGEQLPLVSGTAWDTETAQLALLAEGIGEIDQARWQQLLFAGSGIRHQLADAHASGFGTPVVFAVVDSTGATQLRQLAEDLAKRYAVFNRVDLNLVPRAWVSDPVKLDDALAPLLPRCRQHLGQEISHKEVQEFWEVLRVQVVKTAEELPEAFGNSRRPVGEASAEELIGDSAGRPQLPAPKPIGKISLRNFRSIRKADFSLADVNILHGPNGGGKTSAVEAMELGWAETSQRMPADVDAEDYARHLPWNGEGVFGLTVDGRPVEGVVKKPKVELARCVLAQDTISDLVNRAPEERFGAMLTLTGLEIPDLKTRTFELVSEAKSRANEALAQAGIPPLPRSDSHGLRHLTRELEGNFLSRLAALPELPPIERTIAEVGESPFSVTDPAAEQTLRKLLARADADVAEGVAAPASGSRVEATLDEAQRAVERSLSSRLERVTAIRQLLSALARPATGPAPGTTGDRGGAESSDAPISTEVAVRWMNHSRSLLSAAEEFEGLADTTGDAKTSRRLRNYAQALLDAAEIAPSRSLERWIRPQRSLAPPPPRIGTVDIPYRGAGFVDAPARPGSIVTPLNELAGALQAHVEGLREIHDDLRAHPARTFGAHSARVMDALCRFELARTLRREGPIHRSSEVLVADLMEKRLAPVVGELTAAIVRFEWYFKPLQLSGENGELTFGGLATDRPNLDARMLLNSAERSLLGVAWFLSLHMLQPKGRREVLVLDDPVSGLDPINQAGLASTLRAFVRLIAPKQVVLATHDDAVAAVFAEEFALPGKWPGSVKRLRFQRNGKDFTEITDEPVPKKSPGLAGETERLGLLEDAQAG